jgi:predicted molibdopterin-dependent oxidoreductase YjgC
LSYKAVEPPGEAKSDLDIFLDFARRMDFRDKDGSPLMPWNTPQEVFEAWKRLSFGRPCDYSGLSYDKLTGGSGIQWPCNKDYPNGKERLYDNGDFFTDIEYCESFGHDLETGTPLSKAEYQTLNPAGRAILKACHYIPPPEQPSEEYPLQLSTGRNVYHFHTRTKTGRSKPLQNAFSEPIIRINEEDAEELGIAGGEQVVVSSCRGKVQVKAAIGKISRGQTFMPFHFGYFDAKDDRARAANELTLGR